MKRLPRFAAVFAICAFSLVSCSGDIATAPTTAPPTSADTSPTSSRATISPPVSSPTFIAASERHVPIACHRRNTTAITTFSSLKDAWMAPADDRIECKTTPTIIQSGHVATEQNAIDSSSGRTLGEIYGQCAEDALGYDIANMTSFNANQSAEINGALVLCPDHPDAAALQERVMLGQADTTAANDGLLVYAGTHKVGDDIQVGTYVTESDTAFDVCYWEVLDASGNIISNNFATNSYRIEMIVPDGANSVHIDGCGGFRLQ